MRPLLALALLLSLACGEETAQTETAAADAASAPLPSPPSADQAREIVAGSPELSEYRFTHAGYSLPMQRSAMNAPAREIAGRLTAAGWIGLDGDGRVALTQKAQSDRRFLVRANDVVDIVPLAKKEMIGVDNVGAADDGAPLVEFRWRWVPNEIGALFGDRYAGEQFATATLLWDGSQWSVLRIVPREGS